MWWNTSLVGWVDHHEIKPSRLARQQKDSANSRVVGYSSLIGCVLIARNICSIPTTAGVRVSQADHQTAGLRWGPEGIPHDFVRPLPALLGAFGRFKNFGSFLASDPEGRTLGCP